MTRWAIRAVSAAVALLPAAFGARADDGRQLYEANCAICHMADGSGSPGVAPPLRTDIWKRLDDRAPFYLAGVMLSGLVAVPLDGVRYYAAMPPWPQLTDAELAAIGNYVLQGLNGEALQVDLATVKQARDASPSSQALGEIRDGS
jgi:mono/diheme cytochrome c family protein